MKERWIWAYALLGGAMAWLVHLFLGYGIAEFACAAEGSLLTFLGLTWAGWSLILLSILCFIISMGSIFVSRSLLGTSVSNILYIGRFGAFSGLLFTLAILAQSVPLFTLLTSEC